MATAKVQTQTVKTYTLTLSDKEARVLAMVTARVGGSPSRSLRKHSESVSDALKDVVGDPYYFSEKQELEGTLRFNDNLDTEH